MDTFNAEIVTALKVSMETYAHSQLSYQVIIIKDDLSSQMQTNNYQGILVTDGLSTYIIFTYICGEMQWSAVGQNGAAVVGYNTGSYSFYNHPLSGFSSIGESISCTIENRRRQKRQNENQLSSVIMKPPVDPETIEMIANCREKVVEDISRFMFRPNGPTSLTSSLEPCPCTVNQARVDIGRFMKFSDDPLCYVSVPLSVNLIIDMIALTQQCCYDTRTGYVHYYN